MERAKENGLFSKMNINVFQNKNRSEIMKERWLNPEFREKILNNENLRKKRSEIMKKRWENELFRKKMEEKRICWWQNEFYRGEIILKIKEKTKKAMRNPEIRKKHLEAIKRRWQNAENFEKHILYCRNPLRREKISIALKKLWMNKEYRIKMLNKRRDNDFRKRISKKMKELYENQEFKKKMIIAWNNPERNRKIRLKRIEYIRKICGGFNTRIGRYEKLILDYLEQILNYRIIRQYEVGGYFVDGYIPEINLVIEIDEKPKNKSKDLQREMFIKDKLGCRILRIKLYENDFLNLISSSLMNGSFNNF